jgi:hypothetical protein
MKLIKKNREGSEKIKFCVYDMISNIPFFQRKVREYITGLAHIEEVNTYKIGSEGKLFEWHQSFIQK